MLDKKSKLHLLRILPNFHSLQDLQIICLSLKSNENEVTLRRLKEINRSSITFAKSSWVQSQQPAILTESFSKPHQANNGMVDQTKSLPNISRLGPKTGIANLYYGSVEIKLYEELNGVVSA